MELTLIFTIKTSKVRVTSLSIPFAYRATLLQDLPLTLKTVDQIKSISASPSSSNSNCKNQ